MYLKSLTLKGFKSFASATTLHFEPGITCVVGPNGSGKSNVVDAIAWVMGEQGAKTLRGGKMEDVIFAGTAGRPPLGRAEVVLTIDNSDGALPIDYSEVTISRTMFRNGGSEYSINGNPSRLLDVQELLSDSGIGREMHVIVGQGKLDSILSASPEDRRGFIEEAAGVLKHRKRKEKALRKLDAMQANFTRVQDLASELRRQLKPLGRQAEVARRAAIIQADLRDSRLRLMSDDLCQLRDALMAEVADETALRERKAEVEAELAGSRAREAVLDAELATEAPRLARAQETWYRLSSVGERLRGTIDLAGERVRLSEPEPEEERAGREPEELDAEAREIRAHEFELGRQVEADRVVLADAVRARANAEAAVSSEENRVAVAIQAASDRREGLVRLGGQVHAAKSTLEARVAEIGRLEEQADDARGRASSVQQEFHAIESQIAGLDEGEIGLDAEHDQAAAALAQADERVEALRLGEQEAERERTALEARVEALQIGLARRDGAAVLLEAAESVGGVLGSLSTLVHVQHGYESAIAAALGPVADAVAVDGLDGVIRSLNHLHAHDAGQATLVVGGWTSDRHAEAAVLPYGVRWATEVIVGPVALSGALEQILHGVAVVENLDEAKALVAQLPRVVAVTRQGDIIGHGIASGGSGKAPSLLEVQAAVDEARTGFDDATHRVERIRFEMSAAVAAQRDASQRVEAALSRLHESDARMAAVAEQLSQLGSHARAASGEAQRLTAAIRAAEQARDADQATLTELAARLGAAESSHEDEAHLTDERQSFADRASSARQDEVDARLAVRTGEERARALSGRAEQLERAAASERAARLRSIQRRERRERERRVAQAVLIGARVVLARLEVSASAALREREDAESSRARREGELLTLRARVRELADELETLSDSVHRDEVARAEQRLRIEALENKAMEEFGIDSDTLVSEYGPSQQVPPSGVAPGDEVDPDAAEPTPYPYDRLQQEKRLRQAERGLALLGRVNPLALEEFSALEERHQFLNEQLDDLKRSRSDLLSIIKDVDDRVEQVFKSAYEDTAREFELVFARLFPGGEGRMYLTDPSDLLTTGIEVEARPPGKKVKRLSLLSGGERSLTAVAFLVALFKARPSPFYILDEVEAALDDINLGRLLGLLEELREASQLLVITHQKRTMEIGDALYGVSMRGDGVTTVISQRLREDHHNLRDPESAPESTPESTPESAPEPAAEREPQPA